MIKAKLDGFLQDLLETEEIFLKLSGINAGSLETADLSKFDKNKLEKLPATVKDMAEALKKAEQWNLVDEKLFMPAGENISFNLQPRYMNIPEHRHSFIELVYVYSGQCRQIVNDAHITLHEGEICILDTNVRHTIEKISRDDIIVNCLMRKSYFDTAFLSRLAGNDVLSSFFIRAIYLSKDFNHYILFHCGGNETIRQMMQNVLCEYYDKMICSDEVVNSYMIVLFSELLRIYKSDINSQNDTALKGTKISDVILYVQKNHRDATLDSTAKHFNFHPGYLSMLLKKLTGAKFMDILHQARLSKACMMLENTNISISEIANEIGYSNMHFFYQIFKKHHGCTPAEYRKKSLK